MLRHLADRSGYDHCQNGENKTAQNDGNEDGEETGHLEMSPLKVDNWAQAVSKKDGQDKGHEDGPQEVKGHTNGEGTDDQ